MGRLLEGFFCALLGQQIEQETDRGFNNKNIIKCYNFSRDFFFFILNFWCNKLLCHDFHFCWRNVRLDVLSWN